MPRRIARCRGHRRDPDSDRPPDRDAARPRDRCAGVTSDGGSAPQSAGDSAPRRTPTATLPSRRDDEPAAGTMAKWRFAIQPRHGSGSGLRLVVPWGRPTDSHKTAARRSRVPGIGFPGNPSAPGGAGRKWEAALAKEDSAPARDAARPRDRCSVSLEQWFPSATRRTIPLPRRTPTATLSFRVATPRPLLATTTNRARPRGTASRDSANLSRHGGGLGLRLVVPWGRPRAPLLPALGKPSPFYRRRQALLTPTGRASRKRPLRRRLARCHGRRRDLRSGPPAAP